MPPSPASQYALITNSGAARAPAAGSRTSAHLQRDLLVVAVDGVVLVDVKRAAPLAVRALLRLHLKLGLARLHQRPDLVAARAADEEEHGHLRVHARASRDDARHLDERVEVRVPASARAVLCWPQKNTHACPAAQQADRRGVDRVGTATRRPARRCDRTRRPMHEHKGLVLPVVLICQAPVRMRPVVQFTLIFTVIHIRIHTQRGNTCQLAKGHGW